GYIVQRFLPGSDPNFNLIKDKGLQGQVELPSPAMGGPYAAFRVPGVDPPVWDLDRFTLLADYSPFPIPVDNGGLTIRPRLLPPTPYFRGAGQNQIEATGVGGGIAVGKDNLLYYGTGIGFMCAVEWRKGRPNFRWKI